jgi:hypothetical protein
MSSTAEKKLAELRKTVAELRTGVASLEDSRNPEQCRILGERITQTLLVVDGVDVSKSAAAEAFRERDRKTAMAIAVLVTRRKAVVKDLHDLGDRVDHVTATLEKSRDETNNGTGDDKEDDEDEHDGNHHGHAN